MEHLSVPGRRAESTDTETRFQALVQSPLRAALLRFQRQRRASGTTRTAESRAEQQLAAARSANQRRRIVSIDLHVAQCTLGRKQHGQTGAQNRAQAVRHGFVAVGRCLRR